MNRTATKKLRQQVFEQLGYEPNETETAKEIMQYPEFKKIFRAAKKNSLNARQRQNPVLNPGPAPKTISIFRRKKSEPNSDSRRNLVPQYIVEEDGKIHVVFHQKDFPQVGYKTWWDQENRTPVLDRMPNRGNK
jgi:hypothetical protein